MVQRIALTVVVALSFSCAAKRATPTPDIAAKPELAVFHTERGVYAVPVAVGASSWKVQGARLEADSDNDGIPASLDENEGKACAASSAFHLDIRGEEVALEGARVVARVGRKVTVMSPFGNIHVTLDAAHKNIRPGAHVNIVGVRDESSPLDTVRMNRAVVLCDAPEPTPFALLPDGAVQIREPSRDPSRAPLSQMPDATELAHR